MGGPLGAASLQQPCPWSSVWASHPWSRHHPHQTGLGVRSGTRLGASRLRVEAASFLSGPSGHGLEMGADVARKPPVAIPRTQILPRIGCPSQSPAASYRSWPVLHTQCKAQLRRAEGQAHRLSPQGRKQKATGASKVGGWGLVGQCGRPQALPQSSHFPDGTACLPRRGHRQGMGCGPRKEEGKWP